MRLESVTFRDPVHKPGSRLDTTSYIDARPKVVQGKPGEMEPSPYSIDFEDGLVTVRSDKGVTLVPWTNVIDMTPMPEPAAAKGPQVPRRKPAAA